MYDSIDTINMKTIFETKLTALNTMDSFQTLILTGLEFTAAVTAIAVIALQVAMMPIENNQTLRTSCRTLFPHGRSALSPYKSKIHRCLPAA